MFSSDWRDNHSLNQTLAVITFLGDHMATSASTGCIMEMVGDQDGRIRLAALKAMLKLYERGAKLTLELYMKSLQLSTDTSEHVRRFNLQIIAAIAAQHGEIEVHARGLVAHDKIRLVDDAFAWTCEAGNINIKCDSKVEISWFLFFD